MKTLILLLSLCCAAFAQNQYYVATGGSDSNSGTQASPWQTISKCISTFSLSGSGAICHVKAGTYSTSVNINRGGSSTSVRFVLVCDTAWSVPSGSGCLIRSGGVSINANNVDLNNFDIGANPNLGEGVILPCSASSGNVNCSTGNSVHVIHNYVHDLGANQDCSASAGVAGILFNNHHGPFLTDSQVIGNRVTHIGQSTPCASGNGMHGIYMNTGDVIVYNNIVSDTQGYGIHFYGYSCFGRISNNVALRSLIKGGMVASSDGSCSTPGSVTIDNNIFDNNHNAGIQLGTGGGANCSSGHPILISNNILTGNGSGAISGANGCVTVANTKSESPSSTFGSFSNSSGDNYHLKAGSVAIDGGTTNCVSGGPSPCTPTTDFDGNGRPAGLFLDIGPYEFNGGTTVTKPLPPTGLTAIVH